MNTSVALTKAKLILIRSRALKLARDFFYSKGYLEVDCPILSPFAPLDNHIDLFSLNTEPPYFLHSSPEYGMKKLLSMGSPSIFQISHVFRAHEQGLRHASEFTMAEFYKLNISYQDFIYETLDFIELFTGIRTKVFMSYEETFKKHLGLNPYTEIDKIQKHLEHVLKLDTINFSYDDLLSCAMGCLIEPAFDPDKLTIITDFPKSQAALAESVEGRALRFEVYSGGLELANGYKELKDPIELKTRLAKLNELRTCQAKTPYPIDTPLIQALERYFPDCCGVACGFDRLMMIQLKAKDISSVLPLPSI